MGKKARHSAAAAALTPFIAPVVHDFMQIRAFVVVDSKVDYWTLKLLSNTTVKAALQSFSESFFEGKPLATMYSHPQDGSDSERFASTATLGDLGLVPLAPGGNKYPVELKVPPAPKQIKMCIHDKRPAGGSPFIANAFDVLPTDSFLQTIAEQCAGFNMRDTLGHKLFHLEDGSTDNFVQVQWPTNIALSVQAFRDDNELKDLPFQIIVQQKA